MSGNDGNFRKQFDFYGKMQSFILFLELIINKIEAWFLQRNGASFPCPSVINELLISISEQESCIFLWFDVMNKTFQLLDRCHIEVPSLWILSWLAVQRMHAIFIALIRRVSREDIQRYSSLSVYVFTRLGSRSPRHSWPAAAAPNHNWILRLGWMID